MKALDKAKTDDLNEEQKKLLAELIKTEMMQSIESEINSGSVAFAEAIKNYIRSDEEEEAKKAQQAASASKEKKK